MLFYAFAREPSHRDHARGQGRRIALPQGALWGERQL
jgi:hypothetical protein